MKAKRSKAAPKGVDAGAVELVRKFARPGERFMDTINRVQEDGRRRGWVSLELELGDFLGLLRGEIESGSAHYIRAVKLV